MRRSLAPAAAYVIFVLCLCASTLSAQSTSASLTGDVTDPLKATIAGAKVAAVNTGTNFRYETATNEAGGYIVVGQRQDQRNEDQSTMKNQRYVWDWLRQRLALNVCASSY